MAEGEGVKTTGLAWKVILGMLVGVGLGLILMFNAPVPVQAGDSYRATLSGGETVTVKVGANRDAKPQYVVSDRSDSPEVPGGLIGRSRAEAQSSLSSATGLPIESFELVSRGPVKEMPPVTMAAYFVGEGFVRLLRMIALPLIVCSVLVGIASLGNLKLLGRLGRQTFAVYFATMFLAAGIGLTFVNLVQPGKALGRALEEAVPDVVQSRPNAADMVLQMIPRNPFEALANFDVLGALFFTILLGVAMASRGKHRAAPVFNFFEGLSDLLYVIVNWIMRLAPFGVAGLVAYFLGIQDPAYLADIGRGLGLYAATLASALVVHWCVLIGLVAWLGRYGPFQFVRTMAPAFLTALGTSSSAATLPLTLTCTNRLGVSKRVSGFVVPVGATLNMDGTALFEVIGVMFFAQAFGAELTVGQQLLVAATAVLAAAGAAGIPSAGLVTMAIVLTAVGLPLTGLGLLFAIDRPLDMMRTVVNITGDAATSRIVQTWNPEIDPAEDDIAEEYEPIEPTASHGP
jgi:Na+/H+-dicarboxylate symporter